jgi:hypothetical protein
MSPPTVGGTVGFFDDPEMVTDWELTWPAPAATDANRIELAMIWATNSWPPEPD